MWPNNLILLSAKKTNPILSNTDLFVSLFTNDTLSNLVIASALLPDPSPAASSFPVHYVLHLMLIRDLGLDKTFHLFYFLFIWNEVLFRFAAFEHRHDMCPLCDSMFWDLLTYLTRLSRANNSSLHVHSKVVSSAYRKLVSFLPPIVIPSWCSSTTHSMMRSE